MATHLRSDNDINAVIIKNAPLYKNTHPLFVPDLQQGGGGYSYKIGRSPEFFVGFCSIFLQKSVLKIGFCSKKQFVRH